MQENLGKASTYEIESQQAGRDIIQAGRDIIISPHFPKRYRILRDFNDDGHSYKRGAFVDANVAMKWPNFGAMLRVGDIEEYWLGD
jgi:hypothetical protein